jgi:hypothetical protein
MRYLNVGFVCAALSFAACKIGDGGGIDIPPDASPDAKTCEQAVTDVGNGKHFAGENCMDCHDDNTADGAPTFTIGGTLYNGPSGVEPVPNATILIIDADGREFRLPTQQNGNFYTSAPVKLPVRSAASQCPKTKPMLAVSLGNCNSAGCHSKTGGAGRVYLQVQ